MLVRKLGVSLLITALASPAFGQEQARLRSQALTEVLVGIDREECWEAFRNQSGADSALLHIAQDPEASELIRSRAHTYAARLDTRLASSYISRVIREGLNPSSEVAIAAILGLAARTDTLALNLLEAALSSGDLSAQQAALHTLGRNTSTRATELIRSALAHPSPNISVTARRLLTQREARGSLP